MFKFCLSKSNWKTWAINFDAQLKLKLLSIRYSIFISRLVLCLTLMWARELTYLVQVLLVSVEVKADKKLLIVFFPDGRDGRAFTLKVLLHFCV